MKLNEIKSGESVFIDTNIFLYHFTGVSKHCREFLMRCESKDLFGATGFTILSELCHRLMIAEAIRRGFISASRPAIQLQKKPEAIKKLSEYSACVMNIITWGIKVVQPPEDILMESQAYRTQFGLLTNDSFIPIYMKQANINKLATNDRIFSRIPTLHTYSPSDITQQP
ncbi:MAG: type II toxin-antitoxin system VapC family toxin [Candidatus Omnitrophota bacterium]|nr:type II toxin-antitoxin system VapC family toxin [Candidatus Omnitrophota bacterium]